MCVLWLVGKIDFILCRDLIIDVMGMYLMVCYVILVLVMYFNVLK